jgi:hypothetical protein
MMSDTGSPLTWRMEKVINVTPTSTTARRTTRRISRVSTDAL